MTWKCHVDESTNSRYNIILCRDLLIELVLDLKLSENIIICGEGTYKGRSAPMVDVSNCNFTSIIDKQSNRKNPLLTRTSTNDLNPIPQ